MAAQVDVLKAQVQSARSKHADSRASRLIDQYKARGIPDDAFAPAALKAAAIRHTTQLILMNAPAAAPALVAEARYRYGLSEHDIEAALPPAQQSVLRLLEQVLAEGDPQNRQAVLRQLDNMRPTADVTNLVIRVAEKDGSPLVRKRLLELLRGDWSPVGLRYIYSQLPATTDVDEQLRLLEILRSRRQINKDLHMAAAQQITNDTVLRALFDAAGSQLLYDNADAKAFLLEQLHGSRVQNRGLAAAEIMKRPDRFGGPAGQAVLDVIKAEPDPTVRVRLVRSLGNIRGASAIESHLLDIIVKDPDSEVKVAAIEALPLQPPLVHSPYSDPRANEQIEKLRTAVGPNAPDNVKRVLEAKLVEYKQEDARTQQWLQKHQARTDQVLKRLATSSQTQPFNGD